MDSSDRPGDDPSGSIEVVRFTPTAFVGSVATLGLIGGLAAAYGTFLVGIAQHFHITIAAAGITLTANFSGALVGVLACWRALRHHDGRRVLRGALMVLTAGLALGAAASSWPVFLIAVVLTGVGFGALDFGVIALIARTPLVGMAARLSVSAAGWALGSIIGPLCIVVIRPPHFWIYLAGSSAVGMALVLVITGIDAPAVHAHVQRLMADQRPARRRAILATFLPAFCLYVALESATSGWLASQLHGWGDATVIGTSITAGFWAGLALGRLGAVPLLGRLAGHRVVLGGLALSIIFLVGATQRSLAPFAYPCVGLTIAAVFPLGMNWFTQLSPDDHDGVAWLVLIGMVGGIIGSGAENLADANFGLRSVPLVAAGLAAMCLITFASAVRFPLGTSANDLDAPVVTLGTPRR